MNAQNNRIIIVLVAIIILLVGYIIYNRSSLTGSEYVSLSTETGTTTSTATIPEKSTPTSLAKPPVKTTTTAALKQQMPTITKDGLYIINYTDHGFSPATLQITRGKGVHFVNNSNKAMRIFSDFPNDRIYGAITQSKSVGRGETYDFIFNDAGNWGYHNANNPSDRGTVVVTQ
jgi:plastocyanin